MKRSGLWYSLALAIALYSIILIIIISIIAFWRCFCIYLGLQMKNGCRMTFFPYLMSSVLLIVAIFSQTAMWVESDQEATCQCAAGISIGQFSCSWWLRRQWRLLRGVLFLLISRFGEWYLLYYYYIYMIFISKNNTYSQTKQRSPPRLLL